MNREQAQVIMMRRPPRRAVCVAQGTGHWLSNVALREGTTGGVVRPVTATPRLAVVPPRTARLQRVWAVAETPLPPEWPQAPAARPDAPQELAFYRKYTEAMLRRYLRLSVAAGRVPSLLGRELFQGNVTHCRTYTMENVVIFCMDIEKLLARLPSMEQQLITRIALQHYRQSEAATMLGFSLSQVMRRYSDALDRLTAMLLEARMLEPLKSCQEGKEVEIGVSN